MEESVHNRDFSLRIIFAFLQFKGSLAPTNFVSFSVSPNLVDLLIEKGIITEEEYEY